MSKTSITPLYDRVLIRRDNEETRTISGLYIPDSSKEKPARGVIVAAGNGRLSEKGITALCVKEGDHVLFGKYAGTDVKLDGQELLMMREEDILGIIREQ